MTDDNRLDHGRRRLLRATAAVVALSLRPAPADAQQLPAIPALTQFMQGRVPRWERLRLDLPALADNGQAVPMRLSMSGPLTEGAALRSIHLFSQINPIPEMAVFTFPLPPLRVEIDSRVRLAGSQTVVAIAVMDDESLYAATADVVVTIAACYDGS